VILLVLSVMLRLLTMNQKNKKILLNLAKKAITSSLFGQKLNIGHLPPELTLPQASFVTLTKAGELRGCIGHLLPVQPLYLDVIENARAAAFDDFRFPPLTPSELPQIEIEISLLDLPQKFFYSSPQELIAFLSQHHPGVIIKKAFHQATFLPQVWEELKNPTEFMNQLCQKAGLPATEWRKMSEVEIYYVSSFSTFI